jgi:hypothetical protein
MKTIDYSKYRRPIPDQKNKGVQTAIADNWSARLFFSSRSDMTLDCCSPECWPPEPDPPPPHGTATRPDLA